ncbi:hypothetical protein ACH5RR_024702 [Cinchona calisaya]|uniref:F-box protein At3g26010-like beta-propeller domain-containing protein n=1 Tax=Cinchona calisaya TaxID=153742 RepID=A0ABD2YXH2_9GENT
MERHLALALPQKFKRRVDDPSDEAEHQSKRRLVSSAYGRTVFGVFCQPYPTPILHDWMRLSDKIFSPRFSATSKEGKHLQGGLKSDLSLSFLDESFGAACKGFYVVASSRGYLLCLNKSSRSQNTDYVICNPMTKEFEVLPRSQHAHVDVAIALIIDTDTTDSVTSIDELEFKVAKTAPPNPRGMWSNLIMEVYSSSTKGWLQKNVVADVAFRLDVPWRSGFAIGDASFWTVVFNAPPNHPHWVKEITGLVVYNFDEDGGGAKLIKPPTLGGIGVEFSVPVSECFGSCRGNVVYSRCDENVMEVWRLTDFKEVEEEWIMIHTVNLVNISIYPPEFRSYIGLDEVGNVNPELLGFYSIDFNLVLISFSDQAFWYNLDTKEAYTVDKDVGTVRTYFVYEALALEGNQGSQD